MVSWNSWCLKGANRYGFWKVVSQNFYREYRSISIRRCVSTSAKVLLPSKMSEDWRVAKEAYLKLQSSEKQAQYRCGEQFWPLHRIIAWKQANVTAPNMKDLKYPVNNELNEKVSLFRGDITSLEIDAIVNAANNKLRGGGGVDGFIHRAAGSLLLEECKTINYCPTGEARITGGYKLPAKYVIHTVGPVGEKPESLKSCYVSSLELAKENNCQSIAFPCISTGIYGYPNEPAAHVALDTVRLFLEKHGSFFSRVIFCTFLQVDLEIYERLMHIYFPKEAK